VENLTTDPASIVVAPDKLTGPLTKYVLSLLKVKSLWLKTAL